MTYAQAGETEKAKSAAKRFLQRYPDFTITEHLANKDIQRADQRDHYREGLRKAGFPD